jgi:hypothetical protein
VGRYDFAKGGENKADWGVGLKPGVESKYCANKNEESYFPTFDCAVNRSTFDGP